MGGCDCEGERERELVSFSGGYIHGETFHVLKL